MKLEKIICYIDGSSRGNPGEAGIGIAIYDENKRQIDTISQYIGRTSNNVAEYLAFLIALQEGIKRNVQCIEVLSDSELLVNQIKGIYSVKDEKLRCFYILFHNLRKYFKEFKINLIPREENKFADRLANNAADRFC